MPNRFRVPEYQGTVERTRIHSLIQRGLQYPLLAVIAGPGYGKTQSVASYLTGKNVKVLWFRFRKPDNFQTHFWKSLTWALEQEFPDISEELRALDFPVTPSALDAFMQILIRGFGKHGQVVWVWDDFGEITNPEIREFLKFLAETELEMLRLVVITNSPASTDSIAYMFSKCFLILGKDLRFTAEEISALYGKYGIHPEKDEIAGIERYTEGWPLPLHLMVLNHEQIGFTGKYDGRLNHQSIAYIFEEQYFNAYPQQLRMLFIKLSLLDSFSWDFVMDNYPGGRADLDLLLKHVFVINVPATGHLVFHNLYRQFLQEKKYLLTKEEEQLFWKKSAGYYASRELAGEALACYRKCGDAIGMLNVIVKSAKTQFGITGKNAAYYLEHIDSLTPEEIQEHPAADGIRALIYLNTYQLEKAEALLLDLETRLLKSEKENKTAQLGEVYLVRGFLYMMRAREDFSIYFKKAAQYLPNGSILKGEHKLRLHNNHCFNMMNNLPGAKERIERAVHEGVSWACRALDGGMSGMEYLFSAEAAYLSSQPDDAEQHAYRAIYKAEAASQHDLVCNARIILARIGLQRGNYGEMKQQIRQITEYAEKYGIGALKDIRDTALTWYYIKLHDYKQIPKSILTMNRSDWPVMVLGRAQIVYAGYLIHMGEYAKMIGMLEHHPSLSLKEVITHDGILLNILLAIGYCRLGKTEAALKAFWTACDMTCSNGLIMPFAEAQEHIRLLTDLARRQDTYVFDSRWLALIDEEAASLSKKTAAMRAAYRKQNPETSPCDNPLTRREMEVLKALSQGLTREEIAGKQYISINTVKTFIRNIYNKLNASNRAEAISIAIARGYIQVSVPEPF